MMMITIILELKDRYSFNNVKEEQCNYFNNMERQFFLFVQLSGDEDDDDDDDDYYYIRIEG